MCPWVHDASIGPCWHSSVPGGCYKAVDGDDIVHSVQVSLQLFYQQTCVLVHCCSLLGAGLCLAGRAVYGVVLPVALQYQGLFST